MSIFCICIIRLEGKLVGYHAYHATRADLLRRLGCGHESRAAYDKAIELAGNSAESAYLRRRRPSFNEILEGRVGERHVSIFGVLVRSNRAIP